MPVYDRIVDTRKWWTSTPKNGRPLFVQWFYRKMTPGFPKNDHFSDPFRTLLAAHFTYVTAILLWSVRSNVFICILFAWKRAWISTWGLNHIKQNSLKCQLKHNLFCLAACKFYMNDFCNMRFTIQLYQKNHSCKIRFYRMRAAPIMSWSPVVKTEIKEPENNFENSSIWRANSNYFSWVHASHLMVKSSSQVGPAIVEYPGGMGYLSILSLRRADIVILLHVIRQISNYLNICSKNSVM